MFTSPGEICCSVFGIDIYYYGIIMGAAVFAGAFFSDFVRKKYYSAISENDFWNVLLTALIFGFLGARIYYCLFNFSYYSNHISEILNFRQGGLSIHGGIIFGFLGALVFVSLKRLPALQFCDLFSYGLILAQSIGRWGNFFNSEAFGKPADLFCKLFIPVAQRPSEYIDYQYFHPAFLYESVLDLIIFILLFFFIRKWVKSSYGFVFAAYIFLYSIARIFVEVIRIDSIYSVFNIPLPIFVSILLIITSLCFSVCLYKKYFKM